MDKEYVVLDLIDRNGDTTQREIARGAGISVGAVNLLLKRMAQKGLVKVERLNAKTLRYILTPKGMREKVRLTYHFTRQSYRRISLLSEAVRTLVRDKTAENPSLKTVILFGPADEVREIVKIGLAGTGMAWEAYETLDDLTAHREPPPKSRLLLVWRPEEEELLGERQDRPVNILNGIKLQS